MKEQKLYVDDRDIPYSTTKIPPLKTKSDIDGILARWGITKISWEFNLDKNKVKLQFELPPEKFKDSTLRPVVTLEPPRIWNKQKRHKIAMINWQVSLRILHWFIKDTLAMAYAMQSQKVVAFLPYIKTRKDETVKDSLIPMLSTLKSLPSPKKEEKVIETEFRVVEGNQ